MWMTYAINAATATSPPVKSRMRKPTRKSAPSSATTVPMQPQRRGSALGSGSESSTQIKPTSGVKMRLIRNDQPKPKRRDEPSIPTNAEIRQPLSSPKIITNRPIFSAVCTFVYSFTSTSMILVPPASMVTFLGFSSVPSILIFTHSIFSSVLKASIASLGNSCD